MGPTIPENQRLPRRPLLQSNYDSPCRCCDDRCLFSDCLFIGGHTIGSRNSWLLFSSPILLLSQLRSSSNEKKGSQQSLTCWFKPPTSGFFSPPCCSTAKVEKIHFFEPKSQVPVKITKNERHPIIQNSRAQENSTGLKCLAETKSGAIAASPPNTAKCSCPGSRCWKVEFMKSSTIKAIARRMKL